MAYDGYLFSVGGTKFTGEKLIEEGDFDAVYHYLDVDSIRNGNGTLIRGMMPQGSLEVVFKTIENLTNTQLADFMNVIRNNYVDPKQRKVLMTAYIDEFDDYVTDYVYLVEPKFKKKRVDNTKKIIYYEPIEFNFIGYGEYTC